MVLKLSPIYLTDNRTFAFHSLHFYHSKLKAFVKEFIESFHFGSDLKISVVLQKYGTEQSPFRSDYQIFLLNVCFLYQRYISVIIYLQLQGRATVFLSMEPNRYDWPGPYYFDNPTIGNSNEYHLGLPLCELLPSNVLEHGDILFVPPTYIFSQAASKGYFNLFSFHFLSEEKMRATIAIFFKSKSHRSRLLYLFFGAWWRRLDVVSSWVNCLVPPLSY